MLISRLYQKYQKVILKIGFLNKSQLKYLDNTLFYMLHPQKMLETDFKEKEPKLLSLQLPILIILFGAVLLLTIFLMISLQFLEGKDIHLVSAWKSGSIFFLIYVILIGPIREELVFRLPLKISNLNIMIAIFCLFSYTIYGYYMMQRGLLFLINDIVLLAFFLSLLLSKKIKNLLKDKYYTFYFYGLVLYFSYIHITTFQVTMILSWVLVFLVLLGNMGSFALISSFVRLKYGIKYSILVHIGLNTLLSIPDLLKLITG